MIMIHSILKKLWTILRGKKLKNEQFFINLMQKISFDVSILIVTFNFLYGNHSREPTQLENTFG